MAFCTPDELHRLYVTERLTAEEIGTRFGVTFGAVFKALIRAKIPRRPRGIAKRGKCPRRQEIVSLHEQGVTVGEMVNRLDLPIHSVRTHLIDAGITAHRRHRSPRKTPLGKSVKRGRYVTWVASGYRPRVPLSKTEGINLGIFRPCDFNGDHVAAEAAARRAAAEFCARMTPTGCHWQVIQELQREGIVPAHVLPLWVYKLPGSDQYSARNGKGPRALKLTEAFADPMDAHRAFREALAHRGRG